MISAVRKAVRYWGPTVVFSLVAVILLQRHCAKRSGYVDPGTVLRDVPVRSIPEMKLTSLSSVAQDRPIAVHLFGTWCGSCMQEWGSLPSFHLKYRDRMPLVPLGIDGPKELISLLRVRPIAVPVFMGGSEAERVLAPPGYPYTVFLAPNMTVLHDHMGPINHSAYETALSQWDRYQKDPTGFQNPKGGSPKGAKRP